MRVFDYGTVSQIHQRIGITVFHITMKFRDREIRFGGLSIAPKHPKGNHFRGLGLGLQKSNEDAALFDVLRHF
jgi:hypothetical protein